MCIRVILSIENNSLSSPVEQGFDFLLVWLSGWGKGAEENPGGGEAWAKSTIRITFCPLMQKD
jgi:hypothetical protein